jgi:hypothetical protein
VSQSQSSAEFRLRALECYRWAQEAVGPRRKKPWLIMAQLWLDRAENAERDDRQNGAPNEPDSSTPPMLGSNGARLEPKE